MISKAQAMDFLFSDKTIPTVKKLSKQSKEEPVQQKKNIKDQKKHPREAIAWTSYFFKTKKWLYFQKIVNSVMEEKEMQRLLKKSELLHSRPIADCILASIVSKRKLKKYKVRWGYDLPQSIVDLLCTFTR